MDHRIPIFEVKESSLQEFENEIFLHCFELKEAVDGDHPKIVYSPPGHLFDQVTGALVISMNSDWKPFLCESQGKNCEDSRRYLNPEIDFLSRLALWCKRYNADRISQPGGRYFLSSEGVWRKLTPDSERDWVAHWSLPRESWLLRASGIAG